MAHFAEIDTGTSTVIRVLVVHNDVTDLDGVEDEQRGTDFLDDLLPGSGPWVQTSYNKNFRHNFAGPGHTWDAASDAFYGPQPFPSWSLDEDYRWQPPTPRPDATNRPFEWDEDTTSWITPNQFDGDGTEYRYDHDLDEWVEVE